jgi:hypothetical protein
MTLWKAWMRTVDLFRFFATATDGRIQSVAAKIEGALSFNVERLKSAVG